MEESRTPLPETVSNRWYNADSFDPADKWSGLDPRRTALVLVDLINWQAHPDGGSIHALRQAGSTTEADYLVERCRSMVLPRLSGLIESARTAGVRVVHARLASVSGDYSDLVPAFQAYAAVSDARDGTWATESIEGLVADGDLSVTKAGSGAFTTSTLDAELRAMGITTLVYAGVLTNACVLLTAAAGFDLGYRQYVVADCTAAQSDEDQAFAEKFMDAYIAQVVSSEETADAFTAAR